MRPARPAARRGNAGPRDGEAAVAGVVAAIIITAGFVGFLAAVNLTWIPAWVTNSEAAHAAELREDLGDWATAAEDHLARGLVNRTFSRELAVGQAGLPVFGAGASAGRVAYDQGLTLTVRHDGAVVATANGGLAASTGATRYPAQTLRYALGALETKQGDDRYVDLRNLFKAERAAGGKLGLSVQAPTLTGSAQEAGGTGEITALGTVASATSSPRGPGTVRLTLDGAGAAAWRGAAERALGAASLQGETSANCGGSTKAWCLDAATNDADTLDLYLLNVADGWTLTTGTIRVEVRS